MPSINTLIEGALRELRPGTRTIAGKDALRTAPAHQMPAKDLVPNDCIKVLMVGATESNLGNWTKRWVGLFWPIDDRCDSSLLIANLNPQDGRHEKKTLAIHCHAGRSALRRFVECLHPKIGLAVGK
jgi:hypothetical protein